MAIAGVPILQQIPLDQIAKMLKLHDGKIKTASKALNIDETTIYNLIEKYPQLKQTLDEARKHYCEKEIEIAENGIQKLIQKIDEKPDTALKAIIFYLNNKAKHRGYNHPNEKTDDERVSGALALIKAIRIAGEIEKGAITESSPLPKPNVDAGPEMGAIEVEVSKVIPQDIYINVGTSWVSGEKEDKDKDLISKVEEGEKRYVKQVYKTGNRVRERKAKPKGKVKVEKESAPVTKEVKARVKERSSVGRVDLSVFRDNGKGYVK